MEDQVDFPKSVQHRILTTLDACATPCCGLLIGRWTDDALNVTGAYHCGTNDSVDEIRHAIKEASGIFPGGLVVCGLYYSYSSNTGEDSVMRTIRQNFAALKRHFDENNLLICVYNHGLSRHPAENVFWYHVDSRETSHVPNVNESEIKSIWQDLVMFRLKTLVQLMVPYDKDVQKVKNSVGVELGLKLDDLWSSKTTYHVANSSVLLHNSHHNRRHGNDDDASNDSDDDDAGRHGDGDANTQRKPFCGIDESEPCSEIFQKIHDDVSGELRTRRKIKDYSQEILNIKVLRCATPQNEKEKTAFFIYVDEEPASYVCVNLPVDCIVLADSSEPVGNLPTLFTKTISSQLQSLAQCACQFYEDKKLAEPKPFHIKPLGLDHVITVHYPDDTDEDQLQEHRQWLHSKLHLPKDQPLLRRSNVFTFPDERQNLVYLQNTHLGLPSSGVRDGTVYCVQGTYSYHHYMQDGMNDNGWGCAYRSLQTIVSWFRHQGYTPVSVPTHKEIQQALVDIGDKEPKFVGSRQWIGSTEVGFCLDHLLQVQSKYLIVNAGRDLADKGRELAQHFTSQGTPIMIGGGVLAHTILGVDFNEQTGELKFLILDPHYTGGEDLREIQGKGWCGWKGPDFWDKTAFYNLCMPQRPKMI